METNASCAKTSFWIRSDALSTGTRVLSFCAYTALVATSLVCAGCSKESGPPPKAAKSSPAEASYPVPETSALEAHIRKQLPWFAVSHIERVDFITGSHGRVSVRATLMLEQELYKRSNLMDAVKKAGLTRADVELLRERWSAISRRACYAVAHPQGTTVDARGELECLMTVDGWNLFGKVQLDRDVSGEPVDELLPNAIVVSRPEVTRFLADVNTEKQVRGETIRALEEAKSHRVAALATVFAKGAAVSGMWNATEPFRITFTADLESKPDPDGQIRVWAWGNIDWTNGSAHISASGSQELSKNPNVLITGTCFYRLEAKSIHCELHLFEWDPGFKDYTGDITRTFIFDGERFQSIGSGADRFGVTRLGAQ